MLVIMAHCGNQIPHLGDFIHSFHMPFFFLVSGMFIKGLPLKEGFFKYSKRLLIPFAITGVITLVILGIFAIVLGRPMTTIVFHRTITTIFATTALDPNVLFGEMDNVGPIWFLFGMFWACWITSYLRHKYDTITQIIFSLSLFAIAGLSIKAIRLPFSLQAGMAAVILLYVGLAIKAYDMVDKIKNLPKVVITLLLISWFVAAWKSRVDISLCKYPFGLISMITAVFASTIFLRTSSLLTFVKGGVRRHTMSILCAHSIVWNVLWVFGNPFEGMFDLPKSIMFVFEALCQISMALIGAYMLRSIPLIGKYFD